MLDALLPLCAALLALAFAALLLRSLLRRRSGEKVLWALGFLFFALAAGCEALAQRIGWSPALFRTYYLAGGVLTVAYLGAGSAWLLLPSRAATGSLGGLAVATAAAWRPSPSPASTARRSPRPRTAGRRRTRRSPGTLHLGRRAQLAREPVPDRRRALLDRAAARVRANLWIGGGALVVALATGLSRAGSYQLVYAGELLGIALMFAGFAFVGKQPRRRPSPRPSRASGTARKPGPRSRGSCGSGARSSGRRPCVPAVRAYVGRVHESSTSRE